MIDAASVASGCILRIVCNVYTYSLLEMLKYLISKKADNLKWIWFLQMFNLEGKRY